MTYDVPRVRIRVINEFIRITLSWWPRGCKGGVGGGGSRIISKLVSKTIRPRVIIVITVSGRTAAHNRVTPRASKAETVERGGQESGTLLPYYF